MSLVAGWGKTKPHKHSCIHCSNSGVNSDVNGVQPPNLPGLFTAGVRTIVFQS